jgi:hypothetical protein
MPSLEVQVFSDFLNTAKLGRLIEFDDVPSALLTPLCQISHSISAANCSYHASLFIRLIPRGLI